MIDLSCALLVPFNFAGCCFEGLIGCDAFAITSESSIDNESPGDEDEEDEDEDEDDEED